MTGATATADARHVRQSFSSSKTAAAVAVGHTTPGSASLFARLIDLTRAPFVRNTYTHVVCALYSFLKCLLLPSTKVGVGILFSRRKIYSTWHDLQELLVAGATTNTTAVRHSSIASHAFPSPHQQAGGPDNVTCSMS